MTNIPPTPIVEKKTKNRNISVLEYRKRIKKIKRFSLKLILMFFLVSLL